MKIANKVAATLGAAREASKLNPPKRPLQSLIVRKEFPTIIAQIADGASLGQCLKNLHLCWDAFFNHLAKYPKAKEQYSRARMIRVERYVDEIVPMSDAVIGEEMAIVTATRNAVDQRKWVASRLMPREYGDQGAGAGITVNTTGNVMVVSDERLAKLQETRRKMLEESHKKPDT